MKETVLLILGFVLLNNYVLQLSLGLVPALGFASRRGKILTLGLSVTGATLAVAVLLWLLQLALGKKLGIFLPLIALNSVVLGLSLNVAAAESFGTVVFSALGAGLGFLLALFLFAGLQKRIEPEHLPKAFRGFPIQILAAAIVALALTAFQF